MRTVMAVFNFGNLAEEEVESLNFDLNLGDAETEAYGAIGSWAAESLSGLTRTECEEGVGWIEKRCEYTR